MLVAALLFLIGVASAFIMQTGLGELALRVPRLWVAVLVAAQGAVAVLIVLLATRPRLAAPPIRGVVAVAFGASVVIAFGAAAFWPNSGDEYGYVYVARTLLAGRTYNPEPPGGDLFVFAWAAARDGKMAVQYAPGWPAVLAPFLAVGLEALANPLLLAGLAAGLYACLGLLSCTAAVASALTALIVLSPFALFNGASLFNHLLSTLAVVGIVWCVLRDEGRPRIGHKAAIGLLFSVILCTRTEVFVILAPLFGIDQLLRRRALALVVPAAIGFLPITLLWLLYTASITGSPFFSTQAWAHPGELALAHGSLRELVEKQAWYVVALCCFAGVVPVVLYGVCVVRRLLAGRIRFFDALPIAAVVFFILYPATGGHQYGPRYWFFAWPAMALTIGAETRGLAAIALLRRQIHLPTLAVLHGPLFAGFTICFAVYLRLYVEVRHARIEVAVPATPAVVLLESGHFSLTRLQTQTFVAPTRDLLRNDLDLRRDVLFGLGDGLAHQRAACGLGRHVYQQAADGSLSELDCGALAGSK